MPKGSEAIVIQLNHAIFTRPNHFLLASEHLSQRRDILMYLTNDDDDEHEHESSGSRVGW